MKIDLKRFRSYCQFSDLTTSHTSSVTTSSVTWSRKLLAIDLDFNREKTLLVYSSGAVRTICDIEVDGRRGPGKHKIYTKSRGYLNIINQSIYQTNGINLKQLVLIRSHLADNINKNFRINLVTCF